MLFLVQGWKFYDLKTFLSDYENKKTTTHKWFFGLLTACFQEKRISNFHDYLNEVWQKVNKQCLL